MQNLYHNEDTHIRINLFLYLLMPRSTKTTERQQQQKNSVFNVFKH